MKKLFALLLSVVMTALLFAGCSQKQTVKVEKNGKCAIEIFASAPTATIDQMFFSGASEEEIKAAREEMLASAEGEIKVKDVNGTECYVIEAKEKFSSIKKLTEYVTEGDGSGVFSKFNLTTKDFEATVFEDTTSEEFEDYSAMYTAMGAGFENKLTISMPYKVVRTNGELAKDNKTVTFDLQKQKKIYASNYMVAIKKGYLKTNSSAYISWNKVKDAKKYKIRYKASEDSKWKTVTTTKTGKVIKSLKAGKKYTFKVTAITAKKSYTSNKIYLNTLKKSVAKVKTKSAKYVKLTWNKNSKGDGYIVYKKTASGSWKKVKTISKTSATSYTVKGLKSQTKYSFKVSAYTKQNGKKVLSSAKAISVKTK